MKFAHIADVHIGAWRDPKMRELPVDAFQKAVVDALDQKVDFILLCGDLFHSAIPSVDHLKRVVSILKKPLVADVPVYIIAGSHDFSPSGKTMLDVLEEAGLVIGVVRGDVTEQGLLRLKFTVDAKTGAKICGLIGKKGMLDRKYYESLDTKNLEREDGFKIFMFHTSITELKPKDMEQMDSYPVSFLPRGFDYYAGGHVHIVERYNGANHHNVIYPGPIFSANFSELEKLSGGGYFIYDDGTITHRSIIVKRAVPLTIDVDGKDPVAAQESILNAITSSDVEDAIVLVRISGRITGGRTTDVDLRLATERAYERGAYFVLKNSSRLSSEEMDDIHVGHQTAEHIEETLLNEHAGKISVPFSEREADVAKSLMQALSQEKADGERQQDYESRVLLAGSSALK
ncbi:MAG: exonuclease SbcCD subunit D [Nanoarchaeota archaeon]